MTVQELQVIKERCLHACPPPWKSYYSFWTLKDGEDRVETGITLGESFPSLSTIYADACLLANGRDDLPFLVALAEQRYQAALFVLSEDTAQRMLQIRHRAVAATGGEWRYQMEGKTVAIYTDDGRRITTLNQSQPESATQTMWNAAFIAHCRTDILALLDFLEPFVETDDLAT